LEKLDAYLAGVVKLSERTVVWPHPIERLRDGHKVIQTGRYAEIAASMGFSYPLLTTIHDANDLELLQTQNIIINRTHSECSRHVLFGNAGDYQFKSKLRAEMDLTRKHWSTLPTRQQPVWFMQHLPAMSEKCEVRCFFVGMEWLYSVVTHFVDGQMEVEPLWGCLPLDNVMYVIFTFLLRFIFHRLVPRPGRYNRKVSQKDRREGQYYNVYEPAAPAALLESGKQELLCFASAMLRALVKKEEEQHSASPCSGLRWFARLDISIAILHNGENEKLSFWLNDVECGPCTRLFSKSVASGTVDRLAPTLVHLWEMIILGKRQNIEIGNTE
jgi:hypothetical protein